MKIQARWEYHKGKKFDLFAYQVEHCCDDMMGSEAITFGKFCQRPNTNRFVNIASCSRSFEGDLYFHEEPISYCPFCGTKLEVTIIE